MPYGVSKQKGRDGEWLKEACRELVKKNKIVEFLSDVATGKDVEQAVGSEGEVIRIPAAIRDRIKATEILLDRGFGKAEQVIEMNDVTKRPNREELESALTRLRNDLERAGVVEGK